MGLILAGGGEPEGDGVRFHRQLLALAGEPERVLHVPAARADSQSRQAEFAAAYADVLGRDLRVLELHGQTRTAVDCAAAFDWADLIYLDGGDSQRLATALRQHGLSESLRQRIEGPRWLLGFSAGANVLHCWGWSAGPIHRGGSGYEAAKGLDLLPGGFAPHRNDPDRNRSLQSFLQTTPGSWLCAADQTAVLIQNDRYQVIGTGLARYEQSEGELRIRDLADGEQGRSKELYRGA